MKNQSVYAVLVHYCGITDTVECINSLINQTYQNLEVILVDNASIDNGAKIIEHEFPDIVIVKNKINLGPAGGYNSGLRHALGLGAEFIYLVNNDTISDPDTVCHLLCALNNKEIGIVSPIIYYYHEPQKIWSAGGNICPLTLDMFDNHGRNKSFNHITERDILTSCAMMFRRDVLETIGLFDEQFFCYYDDNDLSIRVRKMGYKLAVEPNAKVWHKVSLSTGGSDTPNERFWMARSSVLFYRKHAKKWQWIFIIPWRLLSLIKMVLRLTLHCKYKSAISYLNGIWLGLSQ
jgi:GT2 family glycosyltransferase